MEFFALFRMRVTYPDRFTVDALGVHAGNHGARHVSAADKRSIHFVLSQKVVVWLVIVGRPPGKTAYT